MSTTTTSEKTNGSDEAGGQPPAKTTINKITDIWNHGKDMSVATARQLCADHLKGSWASLSSDDDVEVKVIQGGFVNRIFHCHNKKSGESVLIRLYGGKILEQDNALRNIGIEGEVLIFHIMSQLKIGPQLLGVFDGGRIEEFIPDCDILSNEDCASPKVMAAFARKLAKIHSLKVPVSKEPKDFIGITRETFTNKWQKYLAYVSTAPLPEVPELKAVAEAGLNYDWIKLLDWFVETLPKVKHRVVFTHNDMNRANCLVKKDDSLPIDERLIMLDFEFCGYNYRGCDIGHHFKNRTIDVKRFVDGKLFDAQIPYPSEEERRHFVLAYLEETKKLALYEFDASIDNEDNLLLEAEFFGGLYQLFFSGWIIKDHEKWKGMDFPIHPGVMLGMTVKDLEERKHNVLQLLQK